MKVFGVILICVLVVGVSIVSAILGTYNSMVRDRNSVTEAWANVEAAYQRRLDVIPKFVETAKFSVKFQKELAIEYAKAREGVKSAATSNNPTALQEAAEKGYGSMMIAVRAEAAIEAKTDQITELNSQIENIERVINHERVAYNKAVKEYNNLIQTVPGVWMAGWWNFKPAESFKAQEGAEKSPDLNLLD